MRDGDQGKVRRGEPARRDFIAWAGAAIAMAGTARAQEPEPAPPAPARFDRARVVESARSLARQPYKAPPNDVPFKGIPFEQYVTVKARPGSHVWEGAGLPFVVEPLHLGSVFATPVQIHVVEDGATRRIDYDPGAFTFGALKPPAADAGLGFSGFRVHAAKPGGGGLFDAATFQGASFYKAHAYGQGYGASSRALALWPAEARGEEYPAFRAFWIERPAAGAETLAIHALVDSPSATAAARFLLRPGDLTLVDVEVTVFARVALDHVGVAAATASHFFGPVGRYGVDDPREAAHAVSALAVMNGRGESLWRPVQNPASLQVSILADGDPKGFGLIQRGRDPADYVDEVQHWENRPSLWTEPTRPFGQGAVHLVEIPSPSEANENILAYWRAAPVAAGGEATFAYRQFWCWTPPNQPDLAVVSATRSGKGSGPRRRSYVVDFKGRNLFPDGREPQVSLTAGPGKVVRQRLVQQPDRQVARMLFEIESEGERGAEIRLVLHDGDRPLSETWLFRSGAPA